MEDPHVPLTTADGRQSLFAVTVIPDPRTTSKSSHTMARNGPEAETSTCSTTGRASSSQSTRFRRESTESTTTSSIEGGTCGYLKEQGTVLEETITVIASPGTLAESFFDPYADGEAVGDTTTIGTIRWESGKISAKLTQDVTGHVLDFIALDGSVSLSLYVADASRDSDALTWAVATQPWSAGDKLMLRIRRHEAPTSTPP